jgi:DNA invertase Pin-like site-specific DNA recombinase
MQHKGRGAGGSFPGKSNPAARISAELAQAIRQTRATTGMGYVQLGKKYGISKSQAYRIVNGQSWGQNALVLSACLEAHNEPH